MFNNINKLYEKEKSLLIYIILTYQSRSESAKGYTSKPSPKKVVLRMRQTKQVERKFLLQIKFECKKGACSEASSSEEEDVGMRKNRRKRYSEHTNEESN